MGNPAEMFGGGDSGPRFQRVAVPRSNEERREVFTGNYNNAFQGNQRYQDSLRGFYGNEPFQDIVQRIAQANTFQRRQPNFRMVPKGGDNESFADSMVGNPFVPPDIQFGMLPLTLF